MNKLLTFFQTPSTVSIDIKWGGWCHICKFQCHKLVFFRNELISIFWHRNIKNKVYGDGIPTSCSLVEVDMAA